MKRIIYMMLSLLTAATIHADDRPMASLKAQYTAWHNAPDKKKGDAHLTEDRYILQIGEAASYYYDPQTFYVDSLENDPNGKAIRDKAMSDALNEFMNTGADAFAIMREKGLMANNRYKCQKNFATNSITVWDSNGGDKYQYQVDMKDLEWEICDSTMTILDYECNLATTDYHGRKWNAWFAPELAVQDGPWQLCGLPGLIMKAVTADGEYGFTITGLQKCDEPFKPVLINQNDIYMTKRESFLKMKDYSRRNRSATISAMTNGRVKVNADYTGNDDYIETDYHE